MKRPRFTLPNFFSIDQIISLFDNIEENNLAMACLIAFCCGLRITEVSKLKWNDINLKDGELKIICGKGNKDRIVYIPKEVIPIFNRWRKLSTSEYFVFTHNTENMKSKTCYLLEYFRRTLKKMNLLIPEYKITKNKYKNKYSFHALRHSFATYLISKKVPLAHIQKALGHSRIQTTMLYTHITDVELNNKINEAFKIKGDISQINKDESIRQLDLPYQLDPISQLKLRFINNEINEKEYKSKIKVLGEKNNYNYFG